MISLKGRMVHFFLTFLSTMFLAIPFSGARENTPQPGPTFPAPIVQLDHYTPQQNVRRAAPRFSARYFAGPILAKVMRIVDGDTVDVRAQIWLGQELQVRVRLAGIDTPELRGKCPNERHLARRARSFVLHHLERGALKPALPPGLNQAPAQMVWLSQIKAGKYAGRVIAKVTTARGEDLSALLLRAGLARPYHKGRRASWCGQAFLQ